MNELYKYRIKEFEIVSKHTLSLLFADGTRSRVDLSLAAGKGLLAKLKDEAYFGLVQLKEGGVLEWPNGEDIDPEALYYWSERRRFFETD